MCQCLRGKPGGTEQQMRAKQKKNRNNNKNMKTHSTQIGSRSRNSQLPVGGEHVAFIRIVFFHFFFGWFEAEATQLMLVLFPRKQKQHRHNVCISVFRYAAIKCFREEIIYAIRVHLSCIYFSGILSPPFAIRYSMRCYVDGYVYKLYIVRIRFAV